MTFLVFLVVALFPLTATLVLDLTVPLELPSFLVALRLMTTLDVPAMRYFSTTMLPEYRSLFVDVISYSTSQSYWESSSTILSEAWLATSIILF